MSKQKSTLSDVIQELRQATPHKDEARVSVGDLIDALDERGYGAALGLLPLIELTPIGGIPGFPTFLALTLAIITLRLLMGYDHLWAPSVLRRRTLRANQVEKSLDWLKPLALRIDAKLHDRLAPLSGQMAQRVAAVVILCLLVTVPPLELVPFATSGPMIVIAIFGIGLLFRDGLLMLAGFAGALIAGGVGLWLALGWG